MKYKQFQTLGNEKLSSIGLGCWAFGGTWNNTEDKASISTIETAVENGINFFDVAPIYGKGHSELILGKAVKKYERNSLFIATKCGLVWDKDGNVTKDLTRDSIYRELEATLKRLETDYIDLYQIHWPFDNMPLREAMETLTELKEKKLIRYIGLSNFSREQTEKCLEMAEISSYQGLYNMLERNSEIYHHKNLEYKTEKEILPVCSENNMMFLPYSPLMQGLLTGTFKKENNFDNNDDRYNNPKLNGEKFIKYYNITEELKEISFKLEKPLSQIALNWLVNKKEMGPVICGAQKPEHILENISSLDWDLTQENEEEIESVINKYNEKGLF